MEPSKTESTPDRARKTRSAGLVLTGSGFLAVLVLTLGTITERPGEPIGTLCLICGERGLADAILNAVLFVPFGAGLSLVLNAGFAVLGSGLLSLVVEVAQTGLSGRYPTLGDIVFNTVGGGAGALLVHFARKLPNVFPTPPKRLALISALLPAAVFLGTAFLVQPKYPETEYYGQWKHDLGHLVPYQGDVLSARVGDHFLPDDLLQSTGPVKAALEAGDPIRFSLSPAEISPDPAHILAIYDDTQTEVFMVMDWGGELRFRRRTWSVALRLDQPHFSWPGALLRGRGDTVDAAIRQEARALCLELGGRLRCDGAGGVEEGWRLLHQLHSSTSPLAHVSSAVWILFLCFPAGFFGRGRPGAILLLGASLSALAALVSWWSPALGLRALTFLVPVSAVVLGHACARIMAAKRILTGNGGAGGCS
jgi:hypothetical protein